MAGEAGLKEVGIVSRICKGPRVRRTVGAARAVQRRGYWKSLAPGYGRNVNPRLHQRAHQCILPTFEALWRRLMGTL